MMTIEPLENRVLLADTFAVNVNFQRAGAPTPAGYIADEGNVYAARSGYTYGWNADNTTEAPKQRRTPFAQRYDSMVYFFGKLWEMGVDDGKYRVSAVAGDSVTAGQPYALVAEGSTILRGKISAAVPFIGGSVDVDVTDGKLTLWARSDAPLTPINYLRIERIGDAGTPTPPPTPTPTPGNGSWASGANLPGNLGEVTGGVIGNRMYVIGDGDSRTMSYNLSNNAWSTNHATRPVRAKDQLAEVVNNKLYVFGGVQYPSGGQKILNTTQIYDPATNKWSYGAAIPFATAAAQTAVVGDRIYVAGGVTSGNVTTKKFARYDPATNSWTNLPDMPHLTDSGATGTDGRRIYIFGGRDVGDRPGNGYAQTLVFDTVTNTWTSSRTSSTYAPLPQRRAGISKAPLVNGEFFVIGGETSTDTAQTGSDGVFDRVDAYNPLTNTWRRVSNIPTDRHGIAPLAYAGKIYVAGGGVVQGKSESRVLEIFTP